jgi:chromate transporter
VCFIAPAAVLTALVAALYGALELLPAARSAFRGIEPVVLVVIAAVVLRLIPEAIRDWPGAIAAVGTAGLMIVAGLPAAAEVLPPVVVGSPELIALAIGAIFGWVAYRPRGDGGAPPAAAAAVSFLPGWLPPATAATTVGAAATTAGATSLGMMTLYFLKTGALLFGSGYLLINFLRADFVLREGALTERELLDAIAVGQFTPGPVLSAATFIGWRLHGPLGALAATAAIFLPAFLIMIAVAGRFERLRATPAPAAVLRGVYPVVVGLLAAVLVQLAGPALFPPGEAGRSPDATAWAIAAVTAGAVFGLRLNPTWLMAPAALAGIAVYR